MTPAAVVFGLGNEDRADDGIGPAVARVLLARAVPGLRVVTPAQPLDLLDPELATAAVVVVDAVRSGRAPGTVLVLDVQSDPLPPEIAHGSSHDVGLAAVVELLAALRRQPRRVFLVAVEAADFDPGAPLSAPVRDAAAAAADAALALTGLQPRGTD